jgi:hypothetical protein
MDGLLYENTKGNDVDNENLSGIRYDYQKIKRWISDPF